MSNTEVRKITHGFVCQTYDLKTGKCTSQEFHAGDECEWEQGTDEVIDEPENVVHQSYHMEQPGSMQRMCKILDDYAELLRTRIAEKDVEIAEKLKTLESLKRSIRNA